MKAPDAPKRSSNKKFPLSFALQTSDQQEAERSEEKFERVQATNEQQALRQLALEIEWTARLSETVDRAELKEAVSARSRCRKLC